MNHAKNVGHQNLRNPAVVNGADVYRHPDYRCGHGGRMKGRPRRPVKGSGYRSSLRTRVSRHSRIKIQGTDFHRDVLPGFFTLVWPA